MTDVLLLGDDIQLVKSLAMSLNVDGFSVSAYCGADDALPRLESQSPHIVLLDITMPETNGIDLMKQVRTRIDVPVVFLTDRDDEVDQVLALRLGADDYVCKPCSARIVSERIRTILRRGGSARKKAKRDRSAPMVRGDLVMDDMRHIVTWKRQPVALTASEYLLMRALAQHPGHAVDRDSLHDILAPSHEIIHNQTECQTTAPDMLHDDRIIDTHIKRLRKKFRAIEDNFSAIKTIYGVGYKFCTD